MSKNHFLLLGAGFAMLAVIFGAFGAHALEKMVPEQMLQRYHTGVDYQFYHAFALLVTGLLQQHLPHRALKWAGTAFILGIFLFSGSLYTYALTGIKTFGMITPLGGLAFIVGWISLITAIWQTPPRQKNQKK
ncbi:MAG: COG2363 [uncultured Thiotrichaceae bacterium]|uniref:COG2363 n=1 Tax=uncultured Thiotrichaceae bacterium TaxID=298394 RepID=A0A6S6S6Q1_9GAMM|nr:MAG: COG2363 [uncultured Thiotrichaceae bacterium]